MIQVRDLKRSVECPILLVVRGIIDLSYTLCETCEKIEFKLL